MKILSWNIWDGGVSKKNYKDGHSRINDIAKAILSHNPDVAVITEYKNNDLGRDLKNSLLCDIPSTFQYHLIKENLRSNDNSIAIFSKFPIKPITHILELENRFFRHFQCVEIEGILYVAVFCARNVNAMEPIVDSILNNQALLKNDTIIIGDFDTGPIKSNIKKPIYGFSTDRGKNWTNVWLSQNEIEWSHRNIKKISTGNMVNQCLIIFMSVLR